MHNINTICYKLISINSQLNSIREWSSHKSVYYIIIWISQTVWCNCIEIIDCLMDKSSKINPTVGIHILSTVSICSYSFGIRMLFDFLYRYSIYKITSFS
jgi:hypothetical protein